MVFAGLGSKAHHVFPTSMANIIVLISKSYPCHRTYNVMKPLTDRTYISHQHTYSPFLQVLALLDYDHLLKPENRTDVLKLFPQDAVERAQQFANAAVKTGAYSDSQGFPQIECCEILIAVCVSFMLTMRRSISRRLSV